MKPDQIQQLLERVATGQTSPAEATAQLNGNAQGLDFATVDYARAHRCGIPEVIYGAGKTAAQIVEIVRRLVDHHGNALITRATAEHLDAVREAFEHVNAGTLGRTILVGQVAAATGTSIPIVTAGTSDEPVAEEAQRTFEFMGQSCHRITDVGVAGVHRLLNRLEELHEASVIVCIAGMEGALPSVVSGLVRVPVIAVPTSVGYGAAMNGLAALLSMLTSCAAGISVVNIDNGFGAAYSATLIQRAADGRCGPHEK